jgi:hypothetical protein
MSTSESDLEKTGTNPRTSVSVTYLPFPPQLPMPCVITVYTATAPRHPVEARIESWSVTGWTDLGTGLVNNYPIGMAPTIIGETLRFTFDCPAPQQYWEIHIETSPLSPFPNYLDSMIGSCESREFIITYPGIIVRSKPLLAATEAEVFANYVRKPALEAAAPAA